MSPALGLVLLPTALAGQSYSPTDFDGSYALSCVSVGWTLSASLAGTAGGAWSSGTISVPIQADCAGIDDEALADDTYAACVARGLPEASCADLAAAFGEAAAAFDGASLDPIPETIDLSVYNTSAFWNRLLGVYPMRGTATYRDGSTGAVTFLVNNNDGSGYGNFAAAGVALGDSVSSASGGCTTLGTATIDGDLDRGSPFTLDATGTANATLICASGSGSAAVLLSVNLGYTAVLSGSR